MQYSLPSTFNYLNCLWCTWASLTNGGRIGKSFFAGKEEWMIGNRYAAVVLCTITVDGGQKGQIPFTSCHSYSPSARVQTPQGLAFG